jgi:hypothetical protein
MILAMTAMVRDECDIIVPMIEYHLHAGVDVMLITDNGSVDGTRQLLAEYEQDSRVIVFDHPVHDKNQGSIVTEMARLAYTRFSADWVINADADEFFVPVNRTLSLKELFENVPKSLAAVDVPVVDMTGTPARSGAGLGRLTLRDERPESTLFADAGIHAHATHDAVHVGSADVTVSQGNHYVSIESNGPLPRGFELESLHFPWRSFLQFQSKIVNAGKAYEANSTLTPSPRHHGMRDYRFYRAGVLEDIYLYRHPAGFAPDEGGGLIEDEWLLRHLATLAGTPATRRPDLILRALRQVDDRPYDPSERHAAERTARAALLIESERAEAASALEGANLHLGHLREQVGRQSVEIAETTARLVSAEARAGEFRQRALESEHALHRIRTSWPYRLLWPPAALLLRAARGLRHTVRER